MQRHLHTSVIYVALMIAPGVSLSAAGDDARTILERGITALHCFEYEEAIDAFQQARRLDPGLAMAYWGEAMSWHQSLWGHENLEAGKQ